MEKIRKFMKNSVIAKTCVYMFIANFWTCQCLAMMPPKVVADNVKSNVEALFKSFDQVKDNLSLKLNRRKNSNRFELLVTKSDSFGSKKSVKLFSKETNGFLNFGNGLTFPFANNQLCLGNIFDGYSGSFTTNTDVLISDALHFNKNFVISANKLRVENQIKSDNSLTLLGHDILNSGMISSPLLSIKSTDLNNSGNILGKVVSIDTNSTKCFDNSSIVGSDIATITARKEFLVDSSSIVGKSLKINATAMELCNKSSVKSNEYFEFLGGKFLSDNTCRLKTQKHSRIMTSTFFNKGARIDSGKNFELFANVFFNSGKIKSRHVDISTHVEKSSFNPISTELVKFDPNFFECNSYFGTFMNLGEVRSSALDILSEGSLLNRGVFSVHNSINLSTDYSLINEGFIAQSKRNSNSKILAKSEIVNKNGTMEFAGNAEISGKSLDNSYGTLKAKQFSIELAVRKDKKSTVRKFEKNEKEATFSKSENNPYSMMVQAYNSANRGGKKKVNESSSNDKENGKDRQGNTKKEKEIGYLVNTHGLIQASRDLELVGSGAVYNAEGGEIFARDNVRFNIFGRLLNQLGSKFSARNIEVHSSGKIFNTGGSTMEGRFALFCDGFENGIGSKVQGGLNVTSSSLVINLGEVVNLGHSSRLVTDTTFENYGTLFSDKSITVTSKENVINAGKISGAKIDLQNALKFSNKSGATLESNSGDIIFGEGSILSNEGRIYSKNLVLRDLISKIIQVKSDGVIDVQNTLTINSNFPLSFINGIINTKRLVFTNNSKETVDFSKLLRNTGINAQQAEFHFPDTRVENKNPTVLDYDAQIFANEFLNFSLLRSTKKLSIHSDSKFINGNAYAFDEPIFPLGNDWDIANNGQLSVELSDDNVDLAPRRIQKNAVISADGDVEISSKTEVSNTGSIITKRHLTLKSPKIQHGWAYESTRHESLPELEFNYDYMNSQPSYIKAGNGLSIESVRFLNTFGTIDVNGGLVSNSSRGFLNYAGSINVCGNAKVTAPKFMNLIGTVKTNRADRRYWSLEFCNTGPASFDVINGVLNINAPYAINSGSFLYGQNGVVLNGKKSNGLPSVFDISSKGFGYTRMYSVNEYNRGQYADKILGMEYASTGQGAIIRAELNESVRKRILPASVSSSKKVVVKKYNNLKSDGIIHGSSVYAKTGSGRTELGYVGGEILPKMSAFAKNIDLFPYISDLAENQTLDVAENGDFFFKSEVGKTKIPFAIISDKKNISKNTKLPFSLDVMEVMLLKQIQRTLGTGYLADMPTFLAAAKIAYGQKSTKKPNSEFQFLKKYTNDPIAIISDGDAKTGVFFKVQKLGDQEVLCPELRLSGESVHAMLANPAGATVAQGNEDANIVIDTDGFLHATASLHADDDIKIRAARGALFETTTYDAMAITQNVVTTTSGGGLLHKKKMHYHELSQWHEVKRAQEPMLATTTRGDFIIILPDNRETAEFKGMFANIAGNFEVHGGNCILSPLEIADVVKCPELMQGGANRISTMLPVFMKTVLKSGNNFFADVRVFKNSGSKIEALGDVIVNAKDKIEFDTQTRKFTLAEGEKVDAGWFTTKKSSRKVEDVAFYAPEVNAGGNMSLNSDVVYVKGGNYRAQKDIKIHANFANLKSVLAYGTDSFHSTASNFLSDASYDRYATFARIAPATFDAHGDFIADVLGEYHEHSIQKSCKNEIITAEDIDSSPLRVHEEIRESSSSSGFNFFAPTAAVAPVCDGNIHSAIDAFWRQSALVNSTNALLHSKRGADIAANGISTALSAYSSISTILDYGAGGAASLFGVGNFGFYSTESEQVTTHDFTVGSTSFAENNIIWNASKGNIKIAHRLAKAEGNQMYTAAGRITVEPGEDITHVESETVSANGSFNVFTYDATIGVNGGRSTSHSANYMASEFHSRGDNVFRAGKDIYIVIPQIEGKRNVFDAVLVNLENKVNECETHSSTYGVTFSTNMKKTAAGTLGANVGAGDSRDTFLNEAYVKGATNFVRSNVKNKGCLVMNVDNKGASYEYVPMSEVHESQSWAVGFSGLDLSSADAFAYSLGRNIASAATSAGVGLAASKAGLGGFVSSIAASLAGSYVNSEMLPPHAPFALGSTSNVSFDHNGDGFSAVNLDFDKNEFKNFLNKVDKAISGSMTEDEAEVIASTIKKRVFDDALDANLDENKLAGMQKSADSAVKKLHEIDTSITIDIKKIDEHAENEVQAKVVDIADNLPITERHRMARENLNILSNAVRDAANQKIQVAEKRIAELEVEKNKISATLCQAPGAKETAIAAVNVLKNKYESIKNVCVNIVQHPLDTVKQVWDVSKKVGENIVDSTSEVLDFTLNHPTEAFDWMKGQFSKAYGSMIRNPLESVLNTAEYIPVLGTVIEGGRDVNGVYLSRDQELSPTLNKWANYGIIGAIGGKGAKIFAKKVVGIIGNVSKVESSVAKTQMQALEKKVRGFDDEGFYRGVGPYKEVKGHHPIQGAAFKDHPLYNYQEALSGGNEWLTKFGDPKEVHTRINVQQRILQRELLQSGRPNTMAEQVRIAWQAMVNAGIPREEARKITALSYWDLVQQGVKQPTNIPWSKK